jgi:hypothetical protein
MPLATLTDSIERQRRYLDLWKKPSENTLFETLRTLDTVFCAELFGVDDLMDLRVRCIQTWGVNQALSRVVPDNMETRQFRLFRSTEPNQRSADEFVFQSGILQRAEILQGWAADGFLAAELSTPPQALPSGTNKILVLKVRDPSLYSEALSVENLRWMSNKTMEFDGDRERELERTHFEILPELSRHVGLHDDWTLAYSTTREIDDYFLEWAKLYLRRMWGQDLLGLSDRVNGCQFNEYLGVLAALSGRAQKHLCFAAMMKRRHPHLLLRDILTTYNDYQEFVVLLSRHLDAETLHIQKLLSSLTLEPLNKDAHLRPSETAWAPAVRCNANNILLPLYGLEINPFLFLLNDLRSRYPSDWFAAANRREARWLAELRAIFPTGRWRTSSKPIAIRDGRRSVTDLDFVAYDARSNEFAVFQLKWQQPVGMDNRARRSAGKNLVTEGNKWVEAVSAWLSQAGTAELARRLDLVSKPGAIARLFVVARYNAHFSGFAEKDVRATWADWSHLIKVRSDDPAASMTALANAVQDRIVSFAEDFPPESFALPIGDLAIVFNPTAEPHA